MAIHNWLTGLGYPESTSDLKMQQLMQKDLEIEEVFSDGSLSILNSNFRQVAVVKFKDLFPVFLTSLEFEATDTDVNYFTAEVTFKYTIYEIVGADGRTPL